MNKNRKPERSRNLSIYIERGNDLDNLRYLKRISRDNLVDWGTQYNLIDCCARAGFYRCVAFLLQYSLMFQCRPQRIFNTDGWREYYCPVLDITFDTLERVACAELIAQHLGSSWAVFDAVIANDSANLYQQIKLGQDINKQDALGNTALHLAVDKGYSECATVLLTYGADSRLLNDHMEDALVRAVGSQSLEMVRLLLENCAEVSPKALHLAASIGAEKICLLLLHYQPTATIKLIECAAKHGQIRCVMYLCKSLSLKHQQRQYLLRLANNSQRARQWLCSQT